MYRRATPWILIGTMLCGGAAFAVTKVESAAAPGASRAAVSAAPRPVDRMQLKREAIDETARRTLSRLLSASPKARRLFDRSVGYAVFDDFKVAILVSGGGGIGVAVDRSTHQKTYMKMGTAGIGLGVGGQSYGVVFLFEDEGTLHNFVEKGWHADATAAAAFLSKGAAADASFSHGLAVYQLTNKGLMANVDISGTKYWKHRKLNETQQTVAHAHAGAPVVNRPKAAASSARVGAPAATQRRTSHP